MQSRLIYDIKKRKKSSKTINLITASAILTGVATKTTIERRRIGGDLRRNGNIP
jgi:hypothetical protein